MTCYNSIFSLRRAALCALSVCLLSLPMAAKAATISYGNVGPVPPGIVFLGVEESSGTDAVPLYGAPTGFPTGLNFTPQNFTSFASGGSSDITDGQLNFTIMGMGDQGVGSVTLTEFGDYTLAGGGGPSTYVAAGATMYATIRAIDNTPIAPMVLPAISSSFFDSMPGPETATPWANGFILDLGAYVPSGSVATKVDIVINNSLSTASEPNSSAFIAKKGFNIEIVPLEVQDVPEPTSVALAGLALCGLAAAARRRS